MPRGELPFTEDLLAVGPGAPTLEQKAELAASIRGVSADTAHRLDLFLIDQLGTLRLGLEEAKANQVKMKGVLDVLTSPPWHLATFRGTVATSLGARAVVCHGSNWSVINLAPGGRVEDLRVGDDVFLGGEMNVIVERSPGGVAIWGETALFDRLNPDGRLVIKVRDEEVVVEPAAGLDPSGLHQGDVVRWNRGTGLAHEKIERSNQSSFFLEETPQETFAQIGGLEAEIQQLKNAIELHMFHPDIAAKLHLKRKRAILLEGAPGNGKTMLVRALANWLATLSPSGRALFMNIPPAGLHSMWYSQTEANYRETFRIAREAGRRYPTVPIVIFFDELDAIGGARGSSLMRVDDGVVAAFNTELDGLTDRGNILVVGATNRRDALDSALLRPGRFGDQVIVVGRPNMQAARDIFVKYLLADIPYAGAEGGDGAGEREAVIDAAISRMYAPNGGGDLAVIKFRDGKTRAVTPADLASGAMIKQISIAALERACMREVATGESGLRVADMLAAVEDEMDTAARVLTRENCHRFIGGLPQDVDVVAVQPVARRVQKKHRYLNLQVA